MLYQTMWHKAGAAGGRIGIAAVLLSAVTLLPMPAASAADQPSPAAETPPGAAGPLTPVHRDSATSIERATAKPPAATKPPVAAKPPAATAPATKPTALAPTQAEKKAAPAATQAEKKPAPAARTAERERPHRHALPETAQRHTPVNRDYAYQAPPGWGYAPPDYGEAEIAPAPYAPSWYYRERPLAYGPYAYGPYSGMRGPRPMPW